MYYVKYTRKNKGCSKQVASKSVDDRWYRYRDTESHCILSSPQAVSLVIFCNAKPLMMRKCLPSHIQVSHYW